MFPPDVLLLYADDLSIGNRLGNSADNLYLINDLGLVISEMGWNSPITPGYSLDKIVLDFENSANNWRESVDSLGTLDEVNSTASITNDSIYLTPPEKL
tara:strand:+ start:299 stop:595 length:297 start_codon:yes stop_codon:yes gene_type:complete